MIKNIIIDFFTFIKHPNDIQFKMNILEKIKFISVLFFFEIVISFLLILPLAELLELFEKLKYPKIEYSETLLYTFIFIVLLVPFFEELIFRYILRYKGLKIKFINRQTWDKIFPFLVYLFPMVFGLIHLSNYSNRSYLFFLISPIFVLSQIVGGFILTFIRVRISFTWGCLYHFIWNFIFMIFMPIAENHFSKPYEENTSKYKITIIEKPFFKKNENQIIKIDSLNNQIKKIEIKQYSLQHLLDTLYIKNKYYVDDVLINIEFNSVNYTTKEDFLKILKKHYDIN